MSELAPARSLDGPIRQAMSIALKDLHTSMPGVVVSYDRDRLVATVQPAPKRKFRGADPVDLQQLRDCPVAFPGGPNFGISWDLEPGDPCWIDFAERSIDEWNGETYVVGNRRRHDLRDAIVRPVRTTQSVMIATEAGKMVIGKADGSSALKITEADGAIEIDAGSAAVTITGGTVQLDAASVTLDSGASLQTYLTTLHNALTNWVPAPQDGGGALKTGLAALLGLTAPGGP